jgi:hypothetical protein
VPSKELVAGFVYEQLGIVSLETPRTPSYLFFVRQLSLRNAARLRLFFFVTTLRLSECSSHCLLITLIDIVVVCKREVVQCEQRAG